MSASQPAYFHLQEFSDLGIPLVGGRLYTYAQGTTALKTAYTDPAGAIPQTYTADGLGGQYIALNARGELPAPLYLTIGAYDIALKRADGSTVWTRRAEPTVDGAQSGASMVGADDAAGGTLFTTVAGFISRLFSSAGASLIGFLQAGAGAVKRTLQDRGRDTVFVFDYMTPQQIENVRAGVVTDVTVEAQRAIDSFTSFAGTVEFPPGNVRVSAPLTTSIRGMHLKGHSKYGTYLTAADGAAFDLLRVKHQQCEVSGFLFRPGGAAQVPIRVYAGRAHIHDNYMLAAVNNSGIGILMTDIDPQTGAFVPGAYAHTIDNNTIGDAGFAFANAITESSTIGITATRFRENNILSNRPIQINKGGANVYRDNLLQSSGMGPTGVGITLGAGTSGEKIHGNYFEGFQAQIETLNADSTYQIFHATGNHNDNCTSTVSDVGAKNYVIEDPAGKVVNNNGWSTSYANAVWSLNSVLGKTTFAADTNGNCFLGASSGASHVINRPSSTENTVILNFQAAGGSIGYMQDARGTGINGANTLLAMNKNSITNRTINAAGTVNASGADYAEYMRKAAGCGLISKGQIVGITAQGELTDRWDSAIAYAVKSTDPSYVGNDVWHTTPRPEAPDDDTDEAANAAYTAALAAWEVEHEAARQLVDRIAFAGQVPVNVQGAQPGDVIIPVQDGTGIGGIAVAAPMLEQYMRAVGKVIAIEPDGRARIIVKVA